MDENDHSKIWIWIGLACCAVSIIAAYNSVDEFYYWRYGTTTNATVTSVVADPPQGPRLGYMVWYDFANRMTGRAMRGSDYVAVEDRPKYVNGNQIAVEYFGGSFIKSRILGTGSRVWPTVLAISAPATIVCTVIATILVIRRSRAEALLEAEAEDEDESTADDALGYDEP